MTSEHPNPLYTQHDHTGSIGTIKTVQPLGTGSIEKKGDYVLQIKMQGLS
jgi:hypothetical protein